MSWAFIHASIVETLKQSIELTINCVFSGTRTVEIIGENYCVFSGTRTVEITSENYCVYNGTRTVEIASDNYCVYSGTRTVEITSENYTITGQVVEQVGQLIDQRVFIVTTRNRLASSPTAAISSSKEVGCIMLLTQTACRFAWQMTA